MEDSYAGWEKTLVPLLLPKQRPWTQLNGAENIPVRRRWRCSRNPKNGRKILRWRMTGWLGWGLMMGQGGRFLLSHWISSAHAADGVDQLKAVWGFT